MSWFALKEKNPSLIRTGRITEETIVLQVAKVLFCEGYGIPSISSSYRFNEEQKETLRDITKNKHGGGFDIIIINEYGIKTGVEVKTRLSLSSFQNALGQTLRYLKEEKQRFKNALIFASDFTDEKTAIEIQKIMQKVYEPITIRTLFPIGDKQIKKIRSANFLHNE